MTSTIYGLMSSVSPLMQIFGAPLLGLFVRAIPELVDYEYNLWFQRKQFSVGPHQRKSRIPFLHSHGWISSYLHWVI